MSEAHDYFTGAQAPVMVPDAGPGSARCDLTVKGMRKSFGKGQLILKGVSFSVHQGETVALIGSNGAGKSTALRCALRLIEPDEGTVDLFGTTISDARQNVLRRSRTDVGFVFQKHNLVPRVSALTNVIHGNLGRSGGPAGWSQLFASRSLRQQALACLERVGLSDHAMKRADQLSGGQSQRVAIARALMQQPRMIVADEPVASLDPVAGQEVMDLFHRLTKEEGITLLFTSHNVQQALDYSDRILAIKRGEIVLDAPSNSLKAEDLNEHYG